jgi:hypothetical protein
MKFKALEFNHIVDFGHEYQLRLLTLGDYSVFQVSLNWADDYLSGPFLQLQSGGGTLLSVIAFAGKLGIDFDFFGRYWKSLDS